RAGQPGRDPAPGRGIHAPVRPASRRAGLRRDRPQPGLSNPGGQSRTRRRPARDDAAQARLAVHFPVGRALMPRMTNGIGTWFCPAHFAPGWGWDDAVECAMFLYFPVWPLRVVHLREIHGGSFAPDKYQAFPLRWSDQLVRHVLIRRWLVGFVGLGVL